MIVRPLVGRQRAPWSSDDNLLIVIGPPPDPRCWASKQAQTVTGLAHDDNITIVATGPGGSFVFTYTWTLVILEPTLILVAHSPGTAAPAFDKAEFDYTLTLDPGATSTDTTVTKEPGDLFTTIVHRSFAAGNDVPICDNCTYDEVGEHLSACAHVRFGIIQGTIGIIQGTLGII